MPWFYQNHIQKYVPKLGSHSPYPPPWLIRHLCATRGDSHHPFGSLNRILPRTLLSFPIGFAPFFLNPFRIFQNGKG